VKRNGGFLQKQKASFSLLSYLFSADAINLLSYQHRVADAYGTRDVDAGQ